MLYPRSSTFLLVSASTLLRASSVSVIVVFSVSVAEYSCSLVTSPGGPCGPCGPVGPSGPRAPVGPSGPMKLPIFILAIIQSSLHQLIYRCYFLHPLQIPVGCQCHCSTPKGRRFRLPARQTYLRMVP